MISPKAYGDSRNCWRKQFPIFSDLYLFIYLFIYLQYLELVS